MISGTLIFTPPFYNYRFWVLLAIAMVWALRAKRALRALHSTPVIRPAPDPRNLPGDLVTVIIPAKNEEKNIRECLHSLLAQDYSRFEIIVANDNSSDKTEEVLKSFGDKIKYLNVPPTPKGWTGKNFAIHSAIALAQGSWFLFTDADTRHEPSSISASLTYAQSRDFEFLTLLPRCLSASLVEDIVQPTAMGFIGLWFPIEKINAHQSPVYFANGQYLLMRRDLYKKLGGHEAIREEFLEDFAFMRKVKARGSRFQCAFGTEIYGTRMYNSFTTLWLGWRRIYLHAFRQRPWPLIQRIFTVLFFSVVPFVAFIPLTLSALFFSTPNGFLWGFLACLLVFITVVAWKTYAMVKAKRIFAFLHPVAAFIIGMILMDAAWMAIHKKKTLWR